MKNFFVCLIIVTIIIHFISVSNSLVINNDIELAKLYLAGSLENLSSKDDDETFELVYKSRDLNFKSYANLKIQGSSSSVYDKKNYNIKLFSDKDLDNKYYVNLGWGEQNKYTLKANWIDKTHSRNIVTARIVASVQKKYNLFNDTPNNGEIDGFPVEVYINGNFWGLYTLNIPKDEWLFNMDEYNDNHLVFAASEVENSTLLYELANYKDWEIEVGEKTEENLNKFNRMISFVINSTDEEFKENIYSYFNFDALLNYYVLSEFACLTDNVSKNTLFITYNGKIWYPSLYDLDTSWGAVFNGKSLTDYTELNILEKNLLWEKFRRNFNNEIADRYFQLRGDILSKENVINNFNSFYYSIPNEILVRERKKWRNAPGYGLDQIDNFLSVRIPLLDYHFYKMYSRDSVFIRLYEQKYFIVRKDFF